MRTQWALVLVALVAGMAVPVQFAVNAQLRGAVGGPVSAAAISFFIGTVALLVAVLLTQEARPTFADLSGAPW